VSKSSAVILVRERDPHAQETEEVLALDETCLAGCVGLGGDFVGGAGDATAQPQDFARLRSLQNQGPAITGSGRELHFALAKHVDSSGCLAFHKQESAFGEHRADFQLLELLQHGIGKGAEKALVAELTHQATLCDGKTVGVGHCAIMGFSMGKSTRRSGER
jgi:hypothetical protein